ncbi:MAG TPA: hypothetical protein VG796_04595 [Verrucomicrobiales bacterium]|jgi:hypothetical protein|nr:hypothetical protein [Verrucomicrobiales bacterium]
MKLLALLLLLIVTPFAFGEKITITVKGTIPADNTYSAPLEIKQGDSVEILSVVGSTVSYVKIGEEEYVANEGTHVAGPASLRIRVGFGSKGFATYAVTRAGTASTAAGIPIEAGSNWRVILEASDDLKNWTSLNPGVYPSAGTQQFFRVRIVKE